MKRFIVFVYICSQMWKIPSFPLPQDTGILVWIFPPAGSWYGTVFLLFPPWFWHVVVTCHHTWHLVSYYVYSMCAHYVRSHYRGLWAICGCWELNSWPLEEEAVSSPQQSLSSWSHFILFSSWFIDELKAAHLAIKGFQNKNVIRCHKPWKFLDPALFCSESGFCVP